MSSFQGLRQVGLFHPFAARQFTSHAPFFIVRIDSS
jgi:hypothetical protein